MTIETIRSTDLARDLSRILDDVLALHTDRQFVITRWHRPAAVLVSPEWHTEAMAAVATVRAAAGGTEPGQRPRLRETEHGDE
jgi:hypothetical protein